jgi:hypothetical protein
MFPYARSSPTQSDSHCLIYYCTVPNLLLYSAKFTTVQCQIYYLNVRNVSHPLGPLHLKAIGIASFTNIQCLICDYTVSNVRLYSP